MTSKCIWILEDDPGCLFVYEEILSLRYRLRLFHRLAEYVTAVSEGGEAPDLVIADLRLPDASFLNLLDDTSGQVFRQAPFLVVSSVDDLDVLRLCFERGAVDYLTKPFGKAELIIKVDRTLAEWVGRQSGDDIRVDPTTLTVSRAGRVSPVLTPKEFQIMALIEQAPKRQLTREDMISKVWGEVRVSAKTLDVHLFHLRKKLAPLGVDIVYMPPQTYLLFGRNGEEK